MKARVSTILLLTLHWISHVPIVQARDHRLDALIARAAAVTRTGEVPIVVMDLDETVVDSNDRRFTAYQTTAGELCRNPIPADCTRALGIRRADLNRISNPYDSNALFDRLGIASAQFRKSWEAAMVDEYLSGRWIELDDEVPGARDFVEALGRAGAHIVYISSRYESSQWLGTIRSLSRLGLLNEGWPGVILRPDGEGSLEFKIRAIRSIELPDGVMTGPIIGLFENEPENLNAWSREFPEAQAFFLERAILKPERVEGNPVRLRDYR